jgi:hypothetical protein
MAPADQLQPLEGQREETLRVIGTLTSDDMEVVVRGDGRTVRQVLCHLVDREYGIIFTIRLALRGEVLHLSQEERDQIIQAGADPSPSDWDLDRIRAELLEVREDLRQTFREMRQGDLDLPIRWAEWPARTIRTSIPYMLEHEDSHMDELRAAVDRERRLVG